jgi:hypothetical protein
MDSSLFVRYNVPSKSNKQKNFKKFFVLFVGISKVTDEKRRIRSRSGTGSESRSVPKSGSGLNHFGSPTLSEPTPEN